MMRRPGLFAVVFRLVVVVSVTAVVAFGQRASGTVKTGKVDLKSASQLAFGPDGVLFIGDSLREPCLP